ncbi:MAG: 4-hydroxythreonine-4-phosphate dehydrogenase PdxA [Alphaproteobacteria bacterium RIFOXYD12_FULL_60_8]|nr:MAG: 4-hydroxythreonine-4-phosphate dehydrogenase PdxA [Alphaproteobacteria bacterium RIFOXYD12_FULL_60_8]
MTSPTVLALTMGEPAGVGGEITLKAWLGRAAHALPPFLVLDDPQRLAALAQRLGLNVPLQVVNTPEEAADGFSHALPVLPQALIRAVEPGHPDPANTPAVLASIQRAVELTQTGKTAAVVTNPIAKSVLQAGGFAFPGHTEYLAHLAGLTDEPVMMLACAALRVVPVTIHVSLRRAIETLTTEAIVHCGRVTAQALTRDFGITHPRIAVAGLNPHAGEDGAMGSEDRDIVAPAVARLNALGIAAFGPRPADTLFHAQARAGYDAVLGMYHDQVLIPIKTLDFENGVNATLGLPLVRTSPDHGTAFDIAGRGLASEKSLVAALKMAADMAEKRRG